MISLRDGAEVRQGRGRPPAFLSRFIGRRAEVAELAHLVGERRLVTVSGTGGCGKTRLATEVVGAIAVRWADGAIWVDLESVGDPARVPSVVAESAGLLVDPSGGSLRAVIRHLRHRELVLCLDNCEHLLDACARLLEQLLPDSHGLAVIATSRERLGVAGETVWNVPPMARITC
jgi:predicted ATPase